MQNLYIIFFLSITCMLFIAVIIVIINNTVRKKEHLDLIDTSDNNPLIKELKKMKEGFEKLGSIVNIAKDYFKGVLQDIKEAFDPKPVVLDSCPSDTYEAAGSCWKHNYKNSWGVVNCNGPQQDPAYTWGSVNCDGPKRRETCTTSWGSVNCTGGRGFRFGGYDDCYKTCTGWNDCYRAGWNDCYTSDFPYIVKDLASRGTSCPYEKHTKKVGLFCYNPNA